MAKSIIQKDTTICYKCESHLNLHWHHCIRGNKRPDAEKYGLKIRLCYNCHEGRMDSPHQSEITNKFYKQLAQTVFVKKYGYEEYMKIFKVDYFFEDV